jgi:hypothetical protein
MKPSPITPTAIGRALLDDAPPLFFFDTRLATTVLLLLYCPRSDRFDQSPRRDHIE